MSPSASGRAVSQRATSANCKLPILYPAEYAGRTRRSCAIMGKRKVSCQERNFVAATARPGRPELITRLSPESQGILYMVVGIFFLCCMDAAVKILSANYSIFMLVWVRFMGQMTVATALALPHIREAVRTRYFGLQVLRSSLVYIGTCAFFLGFSRIDLAAAAAILQVSPLIISAMAYFFLRERLGWRRMAAVCVGLAGTLLIIRPGTSVFSAYALFPLVAAVGFSGFAVTTRFLSRVESLPTSFFYTTLLAAIISSIVVPFHWKAPELGDIWLLLFVGMCASAGQLLLIKALFVANASTVAPFGYAAVVFAAILGMAIFAEFPDYWTYLGAGVIIISGLYVWQREILSSRARR